jgi:serine protease
MRRILIGTVALAATLLSPLATQAPFAQGTTAVVAASGNARVIVKYRADSALLKKQAMTATGKITLQTQALGDRIGIAMTPGLGISERSHVVFAKGIDSKTLAARLSAESDIEYAVPDERKHIVSAPNDSYYAAGPAVAGLAGGPAVGQWYLKTPGTAGTTANTAPSSINAEQAWDVLTATTTAVPESIVIADIDTGLRFDHSDLLGGNILQGYDMISADSDGSFTTANDMNGRDPDASDPGDWVDATSAANPSSPLYQCMVESSSWHGTQTAGLMGAATNNGMGIASVGYGRVKVMPVRALGRCGGYDSDIIAAMLWAAGVSTPTGVNYAVPTPAKVLNMSLGGSGACSAAYQDAVNKVTQAGAVVVVAAGNGDSSGIGTSVGSPANCTGVIAVAALRSAGDKVGFSDLGPEVAIASPGGNCVNTDTNQPCLYPIMTTANSGTTNPVPGTAGAIYTDSFNTSLGTSFSTPLTSGTVALMLSVQPDLNPAEVLAKLQSSAKPFPTMGGSATGQSACVAPSAANSNEQGECYCVVGLCGAGMLDAHAAVLAALGVQARITVSTATPTADQTVALVSSSLINGGQTISTYAWVITDPGATGAVISGSSSQSSVSVAPTAAGTFTIQLTTTDTTGATSTASASVVVAAASATTPPATGSSSGGGGALEPIWLLWLLGAILALAFEARWRQRRAAALSDPRPPSSRRR